MTKKLYISILVILLTFVYIGASYTAEDQPSTTPPATKKKKAPVTKIHGIVKEMSDNTLKITLEKGATNTPEEVSVVLNDKTKVRKGKEEVTTEEIKAGEQVTVNYREQDGEKVASFVRILVGKKKKAMKEEPAQQEPAQGESTQEQPSTEGQQNQ